MTPNGLHGSRPSTGCPAPRPCRAAAWPGGPLASRRQRPSPAWTRWWGQELPQPCPAWLAASNNQRLRPISLKAPAVAHFHATACFLPGAGGANIAALSGRAAARCSGPQLRAAPARQTSCRAADGVHFLRGQKHFYPRGFKGFAPALAPGAVAVAACPLIPTPISLMTPHLDASCHFWTVCGGGRRRDSRTHVCGTGARSLGEAAARYLRGASGAAFRLPTKTAHALPVCIPARGPTPVMWWAGACQCMQLGDLFWFLFWAALGPRACRTVESSVGRRRCGSGDWRGGPRHVVLHVSKY